MQGALLGTYSAESPCVGTGALGQGGVRCSQASSFLGAEELPGMAILTGLSARPESLMGSSIIKIIQHTLSLAWATSL